MITRGRLPCHAGNGCHDTSGHDITRPVGVRAPEILTLGDDPPSPTPSQHLNRHLLDHHRKDRPETPTDTYTTPHVLSQLHDALSNHAVRHA